MAFLVLYEYKRSPCAQIFLKNTLALQLSPLFLIKKNEETPQALPRLQAPQASATRSLVNIILGISQNVKLFSSS